MKRREFLTLFSKAAAGLGIAAAIPSAAAATVTLPNEIILTDGYLDYEEGEWFPKLSGLPFKVHGKPFGRYIKVGDMVHVSASFKVKQL